MEKEIKVTVSEDTFEDTRTASVIDYVRYSVSLDGQEFDLYPQEESKRLLKYLFEKKEYFKEESSKAEKLLCVIGNDGVTYKILIFGKTFILNPKKAEKQLLDFLVENVA